MDSIRWGHGWQEMAMHARQAHASLPAFGPGSTPDYGWAAVAIRSVDQARSVLEHGDEALRKMRHLLAALTGADNVWRLSDQQVIDQVAERLVNRQLLLFTKAQQVAAKAETAAGAPAAPAVAAASAAPPAGTRRRPAPLAAAPEPPAPVPQMAPMSASLDQDVQAASLRQAARDGTPFCEVCERRRRELAGAGPQREAA